MGVDEKGACGDDREQHVADDHHGFQPGLQVLDYGNHPMTILTNCIMKLG